MKDRDEQLRAELQKLADGYTLRARNLEKFDPNLTPHQNSMNINTAALYHTFSIQIGMLLSEGRTWR